MSTPETAKLPSLRLSSFTAGWRRSHPCVFTERELLTVLEDPRGPETTLNSLTDEELAIVLDALYRNLDTSMPEPDAIFWYQTGVEESRRRDV